MLLISGLMAALLPPALVWRVLRGRPTSWRAWLLAAALGAAAVFAGWRATSAVVQSDLARMRAAFQAGPPVEWGVLDVSGRRAALDDAGQFMAQGRLTGAVPGLALAFGAGLAGVLLIIRLYHDRQTRRLG